MGEISFPICITDEKDKYLKTNRMPQNKDYAHAPL
jgi:hypothetical protein